MCIRDSIIDFDPKSKHLLVMTDVDAPNYRLVSVDPSHPEKEAWKNIIPAKDMLLESVSIGGGKLFAHYLKDVTTRVMRYDMDGTNETVIELPGLGTAGGFGGKRGDTCLLYTSPSPRDRTRSRMPSSA